MCSRPRKPQRNPKPSAWRHLGLVVQRGIVELELFERVAQRVVLAGLGRIETGEHLRLDFLETRQRLGRGDRGAVRCLA